MRLRLIGQKQAIFDILEGGQYVLGRSPGATDPEKPIDVSSVDVDAKVSGRHLSIVVKGDGLFLKDLGSTNGTYLLKLGSSSEVKVEGASSVEVTLGDKLLVGNLLFVLE